MTPQPNGTYTGVIKGTVDGKPEKPVFRSCEKCGHVCTHPEYCCHCSDPLLQELKAHMWRRINESMKHSRDG